MNRRLFGQSPRSLSRLAPMRYSSSSMTRLCRMRAIQNDRRHARKTRMFGFVSYPVECLGLLSRSSEAFLDCRIGRCRPTCSAGAPHCSSNAQRRKLLCRLVGWPIERQSGATRYFRHKSLLFLVNVSPLSMRLQRILSGSQPNE